MEPIDVGKLTPETRWRLMRFAEIFDKRQKTLRVIAEPGGVPGSPAGNEITEREESPFDHEFLECREDLKKCSKLEVHDILDQADSGKILDRLQNKATPEEYTAAYREMQHVEASIVELGRKCGRYIENLK